MNEEEINSDDKDLKSKKCKRSIRVRFGNPALGTYSGSVWIEKTKLGTPSTINEEKELQCRHQNEPCNHLGSQ